jgi:hypothetical protein
MALQKEAAKAHLDQARKNLSLHRQLRKEGEHLDRSLTLVFYSALQLIQAYLIETAQSAFDVPSGHDQRRDAVMRKLPTIWKHYRRLDKVSQVARYQQDLYADPTDQEIEHQFRTDFRPIVQEIESRLGFKVDLGE